MRWVTGSPSCDASSACAGCSSGKSARGARKCESARARRRRAPRRHGRDSNIGCGSSRSITSPGGKCAHSSTTSAPPSTAVTGFCAGLGQRGHALDGFERGIVEAEQFGARQGLQRLAQRLRVRRGGRPRRMSVLARCGARHDPSATQCGARARRSHMRGGAGVGRPAGRRRHLLGAGRAARVGGGRRAGAGVLHGGLGRRRRAGVGRGGRAGTAIMHGRLARRRRARIARAARVAHGLRHLQRMRGGRHRRRSRRRRRDCRCHGRQAARQ